MKIKSYLKNAMMFLKGIMGKIKEVNNDECDYEKDHMIIKFNSDDSLPLNKPLNFHNMTKLSDLFLKKMVKFIHKSF